MKDFTIYHNPKCTKSRGTLELLRGRGVEPRVVEYLKMPPSAATAADMGRLAIAQLADQLLSAQLSQAMQSQQATNHPDIPGWGFGMQLDREQTHRSSAGSEKRSNPRGVRGPLHIEYCLPLVSGISRRGV